MCTRRHKANKWNEFCYSTAIIRSKSPTRFFLLFAPKPHNTCVLKAPTSYTPQDIEPEAKDVFSNFACQYIQMTAAAALASRRGGSRGAKGINFFSEH